MMTHENFLRGMAAMARLVAGSTPSRMTLADQYRPVVNIALTIVFGWISATTAFDYRSIDPKWGVKVPACVISATR